MNNTVLSLKNIRKSFRQGTETLHILQHASLSINAGEVVALVGPSGSGKSTLLQIAGLLDRIDSGQIIIRDQNYSQAGDSARTMLRRQEIGFVYQFHHLMPDFTALENVAFPLIIRGIPQKDAYQTARNQLNAFSMTPRLHHRPGQLSGGEQQRVAIARAIVGRPSLLLADEPTGNLDPTTAETVFECLMKAAHELQLAALIVTHNAELAAKMDRRITIIDGAIKELD